jgi:predicted RNA binding protein YcfA (HicA-like mRNA interferase family)
MVLDKSKALKNLKKKGFITAKNKSGDHHYLEFYHDGIMILYTKISHGSKKDLDSYLIKQMSEQCKLSKDDFAKLVNCTLSEKGYIAILNDKGLI